MKLYAPLILGYLKLVSAVADVIIDQVNTVTSLSTRTGGTLVHIPLTCITIVTRQTLTNVPWLSIRLLQGCGGNKERNIIKVRQSNYV